MRFQPLIFLVAAGIFLGGAAHAAAPVTQGDGDTAARLDRIEKLLSSRGLLDVLDQLQALQDQVNKLRGQIEVQNHELEQLRERQRSLYTDVDQRLQRLEPAGAGGGASTAAPAATPSSSGPPLQDLSAVAAPDAGSSAKSGSGLTVETVNNPADTDAATASQSTPPAGANANNPDAGAMAVRPAAPQPPAPVATPNAAPGQAPPPVQEDAAQVQAQYEQAFSLLKQSLYDQAIKAFQSFLAAHPQGQYSDNAQYWLAESYYVTGRFQQAIDEYQKLVTNYPDSPKVSHGLLKIAFCYQELGKTDEARQRLQDLVQKYPGTTAARLADERLKKLGSTPAASPTS